MLDENEFAEVLELYRQSTLNAKNLRQRTGVPVAATLNEQLEPVRLHFQELTGYTESNAAAVLHHRLALYGPPCVRCGKPLRTPSAKLCGSCMHPVSDQVAE